MAEEVIAWLARQPWSNGKVGMLGISWGGFNAIQMALRRPPALKAILAAAATEELVQGRRALHGWHISRRRIRAHHGSGPGPQRRPGLQPRRVGDRSAHGFDTLVAHLHEASARRDVLAGAARGPSRSWRYPLF